MNPENNFVSCIGTYSSGGVFVFSQFDEAAMLRDFFLFLSGLGDVRLVTFNGVAFDVPFLKKRAAFLGVPELVPLHGFVHVDLMDVLYKRYADCISPTSTGRISKDMAIDLLNIYQPRAGSGKHCVFTAKYGADWMPIVQHNVLDLFSTYSLYLRARGLGWC